MQCDATGQAEGLFPPFKWERGRIMIIRRPPFVFLPGLPVCWWRARHVGPRHTLRTEPTNCQVRLQEKEREMEIAVCSGTSDPLAANGRAISEVESSKLQQKTNMAEQLVKSTNLAEK